LASELDNNRKAFNDATVLGAMDPIAMVVVVTAFNTAVVDVVLELVAEVELDVEVELDDVVWVATRVVLVVEVVEVVVDVVDVVDVDVEVVVDVVVVVSGVADAASDAALSPLMFSAFTVTAYVEPLVSDPTAHCNGCTSLTNVEQPSTPFKYTW
jgi:hypothetical protein